MPGNPQYDDPLTDALGIDCVALTVEQPAGVAHAHVIDAPPAPDWTLKLTFHLGGLMIHGFAGAAVRGEVKFYYEGWGGTAPEGEIGPVAFTSDIGINLGGNEYQYDVTSPPQLAAMLPAGSIVKLSAVVYFPGWNINAFIEGVPISQASP